MDRIGIRWLCTFVLVLLAAAVFQPGAQPQPAFKATTFEVQPAEGGPPVTVRVQSTRHVSPALIEVLARSMRVQRAERLKAPERALVLPAKHKAVALNPGKAEVRVEVLAKDGAQWAWTWPDAFRLARPGVLEVAPVAGRRRGAIVPLPPAPDDDLGIVRQALHGAPHQVTGRLMCRGNVVPFMKVVVDRKRTETRSDGTFTLDGAFSGIPGSVFLAFEGTAHFGGVDVPMEIFDDGHATRTARVDRNPTVTGEVAEFGDVQVPGTDCIHWNNGVAALDHYVRTMGTPPPAGNLRIKRWHDVQIGRGAAPHTFHDYIVAPTDMATRNPRALFHEFGHVIAFVADGPKWHWDWDNVRFIYARMHGPTLVTNKAFAFSEGWADYWEATSRGAANIFNSSGHAENGPFVDFNENLVAIRLKELSDAAPGGARFMMQLFLDNPGKLHTLRQYEDQYCTALRGAANPHCGDGRPTRATRACPPGYDDDGWTCRLVNVVAKRSHGRGAGVVPNDCGPGKAFDAGLCYPRCPAGFRGVGPVCWEFCPAGFQDDGATCRRDGTIFGSDNDACPWYDKCGIASARGCSVCPAGFNNDGCTCRRDPHIFGKRSHGRGAGEVPSRGCAAGLQMDAGLCYRACPAGMRGVGPVCWGQCPAGFDDHGATCYRDPNIFSDDPVVAP